MDEPDFAFFAALFQYDPCSGLLTWRFNRGTRKCAGSVAGSRHRDGYQHVKVGPRTFMVHRIAWIMHHRARIPDGAQIDHKNNLKSDNRIENLRLATDQQNKQNRPTRRTSRSGLKGATLHRASGLWAATIKANKTRHHLGYFKTPEEAHEAYKEAAGRLHGDFARFT